MARPSDWHVLDLSRDPTPGEPYEIRALARQVDRVADDARRAERDVRSLAGDGAVLSWIGLAGNVFRGALDDFPSQLGKLSDSYGQCSTALATFAGELDAAQDQADRALEQGRQARAEIDSLSAQLSAARSAASSASSAAASLSRPVSAGAEPPDPAQVRAATRNAQAAASRVSSLSSSLGGAQSRLEAAKRMARDAEALRNAAGDRAKARLHDASDAGIAPNSWWEDFKSSAAKVWAVTVSVAKVVVAVLGIVVLIIGGPLAWVVVAAALVVLADTLAKVARGEAGWMDVLWAGLACIPATKGLTTLAGLARGARGLRSGAGLSGLASRAGSGLSAVARDAPLMVRQALSNAPARLQHMAMQVRHASPAAAVRQGVEAFRTSRAGGAGVWSSLNAAEAARYTGFRSGFQAYAGAVSRTDPVTGVRMWQGSDGFYGIDPWTRSDAAGGDYLARLTGGRGDFVVPADDIRQFSDAGVHNRGVQVPPWGADPAYRTGIDIYEVAPGVTAPAAAAPTIANPQFGAGGLPQKFVPGFQDLVDSGQARRVLEIPFDPATLAAPHVPTAAQAEAVRRATHAPARVFVYGQASQNP